MEAISQSQRLFLTRLTVGLAQGITLYLLYRAADAKVWPATQGPVFAPLLLTLLYAPILFSLALGEMPVRRCLQWVALAALAVAALAFFDNWIAWPLDWSYGPDAKTTPHIFPSPQLFVFGGAGLFIAHALIVGATVDRQLVAHYPTHFDVAWKMAVQLVLSAAFVLAFWLLLWLGAGLFDLIKLKFFHELIQHEWFAIPIICMAGGGAIHLTDIRPAMVRGARTLALTLLSWLLPMITLIVAGFLASLPFTGLTVLWSFGHASALLLTSAAVLIILINAAYQDGDAERLPPNVLRKSASLAALLPLPLALIAADALHLRVAQYGWTVDRIWLAASVSLACGYAGGYAHAGVARGPWLVRIERWNFIMSLCTLVVLAALFTPIASPARIAVADQMARLHSGKVAPEKFDFANLRWNGGRYGREALATLAKSGNPFVRAAANRAAEQTSRYGLPVLDAVDMTNLITIYPRGRALPNSFTAEEWSKQPSYLSTGCVNGAWCDAVLADLDGDGREEVLLFSKTPTGVSVFSEDAKNNWHVAATLGVPWNCPGVLDALREGRYKVSPPSKIWSDIEVGGVRLRVHETDDSKPACPVVH
jgi:hypothetical protein